MFGFTYPVNDDIGVYASYYMGLAEWMEADADNADDTAGDKHNGINVGVTYALPF